MPRRLLALTLLLAVALVATRGDATTAAQAGSLPLIELGQILDTTVKADGTRAGACHVQRLSGAGVGTATAAIGGYGPISARLDAAKGDWDLAVFDQAGRQLAAAAGRGPDEIAEGWAWTAGTLTVQACRRSEDASREATVTLEHGRVPAQLEQFLLTQKLQMVDVKTPTRESKDRLMALGLDLTEHGGVDSLGVVLHGDADVTKLREAGFEYEVLEDDLVRASIAERRAEAARAARAESSPVPSGRTTYRNLVDYENEMKKLAQENPGLVKLIELPNKTLLGRTVLGLEITTDVNVNNGKPAFANFGVHHAREWPSGEHAMEWAYELINGFKKGDARASKIVRESRNIVVPIVNVDGFNASRTGAAASGGEGGRDETIPDTALIVAGTANGGEYRRKNCRVENTNTGNCVTSAGLYETGTDPNRNYGGLWGGPGASTAFYEQTYRGPGPFSEQETKNIQWLISRHQVATMITNHTTAGLILRAPGILRLGDPIDENKGYKKLGDDMALENGYFSQKGWELYDTTGTTEDWSYNATGGFGFTFEIYCGTPNYTTGNCDDPAFHPRFDTMAKEWDGTSPQSNHAADPGNSPTTPFGMIKNYDGKGNREAYYIAAESTINEQRHSILEGDAPAGATLRLTKAFKNETYPQGQGDAAKPLTFDDKLDTVLDVPASGKFRWHINPSSRPIIEKDRGRNKQGEPSPPQTYEYGATPNGKVPCTPALICAPGNDDRQLKIPTGPGIDNGSVKIRIEWATPASDYDLKIFRPGASAISQDTLASSTQRTTNYEEVELLEPTGEYLVRIANVNGVEPWEGTVTFGPPEPFKKGTTENWTLTCEYQGQTLQTTSVLIARGEVKRPDLGACDRRVQEIKAGPQPPATTQPPALAGCVPVRGFRSVSAKRRGRGVSLGFARAVTRPVTVDVFQQSIGRRVIGERLVARYTNRAKSFNWNGRANRGRRKVTDGYYFVRYRMDIGGGQVDVRRVTLRRTNGRFSTRPSFYMRDACGLLRSYKLTRPVFGGRTNRELSISYRLNRAATVSAVVRRGKRVVSRYAARSRQANQTYRLRLDSEKLRRGDHKVTITVRSGSTVETRTLTARRL